MHQGPHKGELMFPFAKKDKKMSEDKKDSKADKKPAGKKVPFFAKKSFGSPRGF